MPRGRPNSGRWSVKETDRCNKHRLLIKIPTTDQQFRERNASLKKIIYVNMVWYTLPIRRDTSEQP